MIKLPFADALAAIRAGAVRVEIEGVVTGTADALMLASVLGEATDLQELKLKCDIDPVIPDELLRALATCPTLCKLCLSGVDREQDAGFVAGYLPYHGCLKELALPRQDMWTEELRMIATMVKDNLYNLVKLDITGSRLRPREVSILTAGLHFNTTLEVLILASCGIGSAGAEQLALALLATQSIRVLDLRDNQLDWGLDVFCAWTDENEGLRDLNLSDNNLVADDAKALAKLVYGNHAMRFLALENTSMTPAGFVEFASAIEFNHGLEVLHLGRNYRLQPCAARALATALLENTSLLELHLNDTFIGDAGVAFLAGNLHSFRGLRTLNLGSCGITDVAARSLAQALANNFVLTHLNLVGNDEIGAETLVGRRLGGNDDIGVETLALVGQHLARNKVLTVGRAAGKALAATRWLPVPEAVQALVGALAFGKSISEWCVDKDFESAETVLAHLLQQTMDCD